jgi:hypothetical protein
MRLAGVQTDAVVFYPDDCTVPHVLRDRGKAASGASPRLRPPTARTRSIAAGLARTPSAGPRRSPSPGTTTSTSGGRPTRTGPPPCPSP